ncbi:MAG: 4Fe-4S binding protein [Candidatus Hodarchaeota archaeon]
MFPRLVRKIDSQKQVAEKKFLVKSLRLEVDRNRCVNCGICYYSCPNDVIRQVSPFHTTAIALDPDNCSYCGVCQYMCPFDAIQLYIDDEAVPSEKLLLVEKKALPPLDYEEVNCENKGNIKAKSYFDGHLVYHEKICLTGCRTCVVNCPTKAIYFRKGRSWEREEMMQLEPKKCIYCGACAFTCPVNAIEVERTDLKHGEPFNEPLWPNIKVKILEMKLPEKNEV